MVAEKKGVIRMYSTLTLQPFMSLDCGQTLLVSADWSPTNELRVTALAGTDWFVFDTSRSRLSAIRYVTILSLTWVSLGGQNVTIVHVRGIGGFLPWLAVVVGCQQRSPCSLFDDSLQMLVLEITWSLTVNL